MKKTAPPTNQGGAADRAGGATRRRRAGGGWHVSSRPTIWSQQLRANPSTIGRSVKAGQNQHGALGAVGTLVSGHTGAPCWSMSAASYGESTHNTVYYGLSYCLWTVHLSSPAVPRPVLRDCL